jgi:hypothetical protein
MLATIASMSASTPSQLRWPLIILLLGASVPTLPRLLAPLLMPGSEVDSFARTFLRDPGSGLFLLCWTMAPFATLAAFARVHLREARLPERIARARRWGVAGALLALLAVGWFIHLPRSNGANLGEAFFVLEAALLMPIGYGLGRLCALR